MRVYIFLKGGVHFEITLLAERRSSTEKKRKETQIPFHPKMKRWIEVKGKSKEQKEEHN